MVFHVSLVGRSDLSGEIYRQIRQAILDGRLRPGERLSPTRELATALTVARSTVAIAYESLVAEGFATSHAGSGTFVSHQLETKRPASKTRRSTARAIRVRGVWETISLPPFFLRTARFDFRAGLPDASLFPHRTWRRVVARCAALARDGGGALPESRGQLGLASGDRAPHRHLTKCFRIARRHHRDEWLPAGTRHHRSRASRARRCRRRGEAGLSASKRTVQGAGRTRDRCAGRQRRSGRRGAAGRGQDGLRDALPSISPWRGHEPAASTGAACLGRTQQCGCRRGRL